MPFSVMILGWVIRSWKARGQLALFMSLYVWLVICRAPSTLKIEGSSRTYLECCNGLSLPTWQAQVVNFQLKEVKRTERVKVNIKAAWRRWARATVRIIDQNPKRGKETRQGWYTSEEQYRFDPLGASTEPCQCFSLFQMSFSFTW